MSVRNLLVRSTGLGVLALAGAAVACGLSQEDVDPQIEELRQQMREGDRQLSGEVDRLGRRVDDMEGRTQRLEQRLNDLENRFNTTVERLESALRFNVPVHFAFDDATIRTRDEEILDRFAGVVRDFYSTALVTVEGFTDPVGTDEYNLRLGMRRAEAVKQYLVESGGLPENRIRTVSYGETRNRLVRPEEHGPGESGVANRRVVLVVDHGDAVVPPGRTDGTG